MTRTESVLFEVFQKLPFLILKGFLVLIVKDMSDVALAVPLVIGQL